MTNRYVGVHFPKAGGTSLQVALQSHFGPQLQLDYADDPALPDGQRQRDPEAYFARRDQLSGQCVFGHFHPAKYSHIEATRFTVLREPVENIISIYFYWRTAAPGGLLHQKFLHERLDIIEMAKMPELRWLMTRTYFEGVDMSSFALIGRHDAREQTNRMLQDLLGMAPFDHLHENKTPENDDRSQLRSDNTTLSKLRELLRDDIEFYRKHAYRDIR